MSVPFLPKPRPHPKWKWPRGSVLIGKSPSDADVLIDAATLSTHMHVIGGSGFGKSKLLEGIARQTILALDGKPKGLIIIDPHGTLIAALLRWIATNAIDKYRRIHVIDPGGDSIVGINPLRRRAGIDVGVIANTFADTVTSISGDADGKPQLAESLRALAFAIVSLNWGLIDAELLTDVADPLGVRPFVIANVRHPQMRQFWANLDALPPVRIEEKLGAAVRRLLAFLLPMAIRRMLSQPGHSIDFREVLDAGDIVLVNLSYGSGRISEDESTLLGRLILLDIFLSVLGREEGSCQTLLIIDEAQRFLIDVVADILDQARKFGLSLILSHQHLGHLREAGEHIFRSVMANARTKVVFGGLDDDDATFMARNIFRNTLDLSTPKRLFDRPTVIGQTYDWLASEATARGTAHAEGNSWSESEGIALSRATTTSWARTVSDTDTVSRATTRSRSTTRSSADTDQWGSTASESSGVSSADTRSSAAGRSTAINQDIPAWFGSRNSRMNWPQPGATINDAYSDATGIAATAGRSTATGTATSVGGARSTGRASSRGVAETLGTSHAHSIAETEGRAVTEGVTHSTNSTYGGSHTDTTNRTDTTGRAQTLRSVFATLPTQAYSLQELQYFGSALLGSLPIGEAIAKIGTNPPVRLKTLHIKPGWASDKQVERLKERLAAASPYVTPLPEARERYLAHRKEVMRQLLGGKPPAKLPSSDDGITDAVATTVEPPPLKDEGWG